MSGSIRYRLWRRVLVAIAAVVLYVAIAFTLAALLSDGSWPAIGDNEFSSGQATVVPALNVFVAGAIILVILQPVLPAPARVVLDVLLGIAAAAAGPGLSIVSDKSPAAGLLSSGTLALAGVGIVIALACTAVAKRVAGSHDTAA